MYMNSTLTTYAKPLVLALFYLYAQVRQLKEMLRKIQSSQTEEEYESRSAEMKGSAEWMKYPQFMNYYQQTWVERDMFKVS